MLYSIYLYLSLSLSVSIYLYLSPSISIQLKREQKFCSVFPSSHLTFHSYSFSKFQFMTLITQHLIRFTNDGCYHQRNVLQIPFELIKKNRFFFMFVLWFRIDICEDAEIRERIEQLKSEQESKRLAEAQRRRVRRSQSNNTRYVSFPCRIWKTFYICICHFLIEIIHIISLCL